MGESFLATFFAGFLASAFLAGALASAFFAGALLSVFFDASCGATRDVRRASGGWRRGGRVVDARVRRRNVAGV